MPEYSDLCAGARIPEVRSTLKPLKWAANRGCKNLSPRTSSIQCAVRLRLSDIKVGAGISYRVASKGGQSQVMPPSPKPSLDTELLYSSLPFTPPRLQLIVLGLEVYIETAKHGNSVLAT